MYCSINEPPNNRSDSLQSQLGPPPVTTLGVVLHFVVCTKTNPLWKGAILTLLLGKSPLSAE